MAAVIQKYSFNSQPLSSTTSKCYYCKRNYDCPAALTKSVEFSYTKVQDVEANGRDAVERHVSVSTYFSVADVNSASSFEGQGTPKLVGTSGPSRIKAHISFLCRSVLSHHALVVATSLKIIIENVTKISTSRTYLSIKNLQIIGHSLSKTSGLNRLSATLMVLLRGAG